MGVPAEDELERLRSELAALRTTEAQYRSVIAAMTEGIVVQDATGAIITCNVAAEEILGLTEDQMSGRSSLDSRWRSIHEDGSPFPGDTHPAMVTLRTGEPCRNVIMGVHKPDGRLTWIEINTQPIPATGPRAPRVVCTFSDITAYKQALTDLQASEERLQLAMNAARMGTWQWDIAEDRVIWSDSVEDLFGISKGTFIGTFAAYFDLIHADDREQVRRDIAEVLVPGSQRDTIHVRHRVGTGRSERWTEGHGRVFRDAQGRPVRMAGIVLDISDVQRLEQRLHQAQRLEGIGRLAGGIAHDFNNVLTVILSAAELRARRGGDATAELGLIQEAGQRAAQLTGQLLSFARRRAVGVATLDLGALVESLRPLLARLLGERIELELEVRPGRWIVRADASQLEQVLLNLVANARDAIRESGRVRVTLGAAADADEISLSVEDNGAGMPPDVLEHVFEPFFTTKVGGTGFGLATTFSIVHQHGGRIEVSSSIGAGSCFEIRLPRGQEQITIDEDALVLAAPERAKGHETVLLVEDDQNVRSVAEQILADQGYRVVVAGDGVEALALADRHMPEIGIVVTDAVMPRMGGAELAAQLRVKWPGVPVLVLSGYDPEDRPGIAALPRLDKPYTPDELAHRVRDLLDRRR
ncbi:MAG TPA: ATP-binding protein [Kofleriaceae bacterium]|nr:ATP-binding protein [Kofleriaceae bacterium]